MPSPSRSAPPCTGRSSTRSIRGRGRPPAGRRRCGCFPTRCTSDPRSCAARALQPPRPTERPTGSPARSSRSALRTAPIRPIWVMRIRRRSVRLIRDPGARSPGVGCAHRPIRQETAMGMMRRRTRRRTAMVVGGAAYAAGRAGAAAGGRRRPGRNTGGGPAGAAASRTDQRRTRDRRAPAPGGPARRPAP